MKRNFILATLILFSAWAFWISFSTKSHPHYPRVNYWIEAAKCAQQTGKFLVVCSGDKLVPFEEVSLADDPGHALILSLVTVSLSVEPSLELLRKINFTINLLGFLFLTSVLLARFGRTTGLFSAVLGAIWIGSRAGADVDAAYVGIAALSAGALLLLIARVNLLTVVVAISAMFISLIIRQPIGLGACVALIMIAVGMGITQRKIIQSVVLIATALVCIKSSGLPISIRDAALGTHSTQIATHGVSHNLYLGLGGFVQNKWGIVWDDQYLKKKVEEIDPSIPYCSDEYFAKVGQMYWSHVQEDPTEVLRIYSVKTLRTLFTSHDLAVPAIVSLLLLLLICIFWKERISRVLANNVESSISVFAVVLFALSFIAQGVLTHPAWNYIYPGPILLMISVVMTAELVILQRKT